MHHTTLPNLVQGARQHEADLVAASARRVAAGERPLQRMEAPTLPFDGAGEAFVSLTGKALTVTTLSVIGTVADTKPLESISQVMDWRSGVIFAERAALAATLKAFASSHKVRTIAYLCRLPVNGRHAVLTDTLAMRFVAPGPPASLETWRTAFGLGRLPLPELLVRLAREAAAGETTVLPGAVADLRRYGKEAAFHLSKGRAEAIRAYKAITRHADLWAAVQHADPLLRETYLRSGDTVTATPFKMLGGLVECHVSTPFKIRPGSSVVVWRDGERGLPATLVDLGFDPGTETLTAKLARPSTGKRRRNGYDQLFDALNSGESFYLTTQPFAGTAAPGGGRRQGSWTFGRSVTRELPLFVSLAAAAPQGSTGGTP